VLRAGAIVVSFQNGLRNADVLRAALPQQIVLAGMVPFNVMQPGPGAFHQGTAGELEVAASPALQPFLDDFRRAGLPLSERTDMAAVQWAKLLLNLNNAINALVRTMAAMRTATMAEGRGGRLRGRIRQLMWHLNA
jgi:2-dehydropantoate 2-reductase